MPDTLKERGVLIVASVDVKRERETNSGSGFIADSTRSLVVTSANWMKSVLSVRLSNSAVGSSSLPRLLEWKVIPGAKLCVHYQSHDSDQLLSSQTADISSVHLMPDVFQTLCNLLLETTKRVNQARKSHDSHVDELLQPLLYASSVVVLKCGPTVFGSVTVPRLVPPASLSSGHPLLVVATPFGNYFPRVFLNSVSSGCLSGCRGDNGCVFLTDAHCVHGCEGGLVEDGREMTVRGPVGMVGMVISCLLGDSISRVGVLPSGMTLACSMAAVLKAVSSSHLKMPDLTDGNVLSDNFYSKSSPFHSSVGSVVCVVCGSSWASGVWLTRDVVLTCRHVLETGQDHVTVRWPGDVKCCRASVIYLSPPMSAPDMALLQLSEEAPVTNATPLGILENLNLPLLRSRELTEPYLQVISIGYCGQDPVSSNSALLPPVTTRGVISNVVQLGGVPVMLQTSAGVHRGMSGGLLCASDKGQSLGLLVSCACDESSGSLLPNIGFALPFSWIGQPLVDFLSSGDSSHLQNLSTHEISSLWQLQDCRTIALSKL